MPLGIVPASVYPRYDDPLRINADSALVLTDLHAPLHASEFLNKALKLAYAWNVKTLILGGDVVDFDCLSSFGADFAATPKVDGIIDIIQQENLPESERKKFIALLEKSGLLKPDAGISGEMAVTRDVLRAFSRQFDKIYYIMGNHEKRIIKRLETILSADDLLMLLVQDRRKWVTAPYYYCELTSGGEKYLIEHPYGSGEKEAEKIASKYNCHVIMGHSHGWSLKLAPGGHWAIQAGMCCDEYRMQYAANRHRGGGQVHAAGAVIVRDGYPWLLSEQSPFGLLEKCK